MLDFLLTHPSLFIIGITFLVIIIIFIFFTTKNRKSHRLPQIQQYIELQVIPSASQSSPLPTPVPKLPVKRGRIDEKHIYDTPRTSTDFENQPSSSRMSEILVPVHHPQPDVVMRQTSSSFNKTNNRVSVSDVLNGETYLNFSDFDELENFTKLPIYDRDFRLKMDFDADSTNYVKQVYT